MKRNLFVNVGQPILKVDNGVNADKQFLDFTTNNLITHEDPGFTNKDRINFKLTETSAAFEKMSTYAINNK